MRSNVSVFESRSIVTGDRDPRLFAKQGSFDIENASHGLGTDRLNQIAPASADTGRGAFFVYFLDQAPSIIGRPFSPTMPCQVRSMRRVLSKSVAIFSALSIGMAKPIPLGTGPNGHIDADHLAVDIEQRGRRNCRD